MASFVRLLAAVCAMLLADAPVRATTLAIIRTPDQVIIAADSRRVWHGTEQRPQLTCKLGTHDDVIFAMAGLVLENNFDAQALVTLVLSTAGTLEDRALVLERMIRGPLLGLLTRIRHKLPRLFAEQLESGFVMNVTLAAVRNQVAQLEMRDFYVETAADGSLRLRVVRVSCPADCPHPTEVFGVGETAAMMQYLASLPQLPVQLPGLATQLVEIEIADRPALVGPPVDVVRVGVMKPPPMAAADQASEPRRDSGTRFRSPATLVPPGLAATMAVAIAVALLVGVPVALRRLWRNRREGEGQPPRVGLTPILRVAMLLAVVATLAGGYAVMFVRPDAPETARETVVDIQAETPGVEWLQRKPACAS